MTRSRYLAYVTTISELMSVLQDILSLNGLSFSYISLIVFGFFSIPTLVRVSTGTIIIILGILALQLFKSLVVGIGPEFSKAMILIVFAALLLLLGPQMFMDDFTDVLRQLRWFIVALGIMYVISWILIGGYRNASTFSLAMMCFLGFHGKMRASSIFFLASAKTLFQLLSFTLVVAWFTKSLFARTLFITSCVVFAATTPVILALFLPPDLVIFTKSHTASLFERLLETQTLINNIQDSWAVFVWGDQLGWVLQSTTIEERGYVHANHLWLLRTFGVPIWLIGMLLIIRNARLGSWQIIGVRGLILASQAFLMTLFTSPFLTMILLCRIRHAR